VLRRAWDDNAEAWIAWARAPGHDSYWRFHRDAFLPLVPPPGRLTLDVGCGEGRLGRDLVGLGHRVIGLDASPTMARAAADHDESSGAVVVADAAALPVGNDSVDGVVAFMSLQDVDAMEAAVAEVARVVVRGGWLVMAITHPLNTAGHFADGADGAAGTGDDGDDGAPPFVVAGSWFERRALADTCERDGLTMTFHTEHRPLQDYVDAVADAGLVVERIREVGDGADRLKWSRIPLFLHLRARRL